MNLPDIIYTAFDKTLLPIVNLAAPRALYARRLATEAKYFGQDKLEHLTLLLNIIHQRASSMTGHLSLMLALCTYILRSPEGARNHPVLDFIVSIDAFVYIVLVLLTVRCLRSIGLNADYDTKEAYLIHNEEEVTIKYSIMQFVNSLTIVATVFLVIGFIFFVSTA